LQCKKENGLQALTKAILNRLMLSDELLTKPIIINNRHLAALSKCINSLHQADLSLKEKSGLRIHSF
jgi:tRNA U34 5-carboxymethylaminomethyl modifying GTPase MnmE/TrmE